MTRKGGGAEGEVCKTLPPTPIPNICCLFLLLLLLWCSTDVQHIVAPEWRERERERETGMRGVAFGESPHMHWMDGAYLTNRSPMDPSDTPSTSSSALANCTQPPAPPHQCATHPPSGSTKGTAQSAGRHSQHQEVGQRKHQR